ncbi:MAG: endo-1,4-beta-xylanase [Opitutaceae bacterium]|nr:endo-1,4-beta-xylanase [Opitutaceae bacterium]
MHITEFDIHLPPNPTAADFELQGKGYAEIVQRVLESPAVKTFKTWGFTDRYSWKADGQDGHPLWLDENLQPKPAYRQTIERLRALANRAHTN